MERRSRYSNQQVITMIIRYSDVIRDMERHGEYYEANEYKESLREHYISESSWVDRHNPADGAEGTRAGDVAEESYERIQLDARLAEERELEQRQEYERECDERRRQENEEQACQFDELYDKQHEAELEQPLL